ncbi:PEP-CTERM sorting domain-containing protein [Methylophilus sp. 3sh_L]|uniref:PEP-CTERM sorting domain-containing protein n=1 Tax=Methylophilus sp. 3sh_L TaxID=3377114 RepID=UPI00398E36E0
MNALKKTLAITALTLATSPAFAAVSTYNVTTTWFEPDTQPKNSIFEGSFSYDSATKTITGLAGKLSESMTGTDASNMTWLNLDYQLVSWYDAALGGTFAATFKNSNTNTFSTLAGGDGWSPQAGVDIGGVYYGYPRPANNPGNAYALIFVPDSPLTALTQAQINKLAYADCAPGGMMGAVCMTGTSAAGYGSVGTMSGYPVSQVISMVTVPVPEASSYAMLSLGLVMTGMMARRRREQV